MAYCSGCDVAVLVQNILGGQDGFSTSTSPAIDAVNRLMTSGCGIIETRLQAGGYSVPPASDTAIYSELVHCNALFAAGWVEMSRTNATVSKGERTRGQVFLEMFEGCMGSLLGRDLTLAGLTRQSAGRLYAGGISIADKQAKESDTDRVAPRFGRGMMDSPGTIGPGIGTAS